MLRFDHVIAAVPNLEIAAEVVRSAFGWGVGGEGRHPGGTHNLSVPLGGREYLELLAVYDDALPTGHDVARRLADGQGWFGWAQDDDLQVTAARLRLAVREGSIETAEGRRGSWHIAGWEQARASNGALPFFIDYGADRTADRTAVWAERYERAAHTHAPAGIAWVEVSHHDADEVQRWLAGCDLLASPGCTCVAHLLRLSHAGDRIP